MARTNKARPAGAAPADGAASPLRWLVSRLALLLAGALIILGTIIFYARERWLAVVMVGLTEIPIACAWLASGWLLGDRLLGRIMARPNDPPSAEDAIAPPRGESRCLSAATAAVLGLGAMGLAALGLGLAGWLNRWTVLAILLTGPAIQARRILALVRSNRQVPIESWLGRPAGGKWILLAAAPALGIMLTGASITPVLLWKPDDPHPYDVLEYHLQVPREWHDMGRIQGLHHNVYSYFPFGTEMHYLMAMHLRGGPWAAMYQCQFLSLAWLALGAMGVYGAVAGQRCKPGEDRSTLAAASAAFTLVIPWSIMLGCVAYTESALAACTALAVAWVLRGVAGNDDASPGASPASMRTRRFAVAGLLAGLACGVKYTAVPMVLLALPAVVLLLRLAMRLPGPCWKPVAAFLIAGIAVASPWLIRNLAWTGNPVFPLALRELGPGHFDPVQVERFERAHAAPRELQPVSARIAESGRRIFTSDQYGYVLWPAALAAMALACRRRPAWLLAGMLIAVLGIWIGFTHLLGRFYFLMVPVAAMLIGQVRDRRWRWGAGAAVILAALAGVAQVQARLPSLIAIAQNGLFGLEDVSMLTPPPLAEINQPGAMVWLIGDAQGFMYRIPSSNLKYRTVFDLPGSATDMYQAWLGRPLSEVNGMVVIQPVEVQRLSRTYFHVPGLPPDYRGPRDEASIEKR